MKFSNGQWLNREGVKIYNPVDICDIEIFDESITIYAATKHIKTRGDTLSDPLIKIRYSSPIPNIIRVQVFHFEGIQTKNPKFHLNSDSDSCVEIKDLGNKINFVSGNLIAEINRAEGFNVDFFYCSNLLTSSHEKSLGYVIDNYKPYMREQLHLGVSEYVYGLGEHFTPFIKNGQVIDCWNEDGGTGTEQAYKNIPFYVTSKGYGVFVNHPECVSFEVASERVSKVQFSVPGESLDYFIIGGKSTKEVIENYTKLTGKPALPPAWSFGLWLTTSFTTDYDEKTVNSFVDGMIKRDIPLQVFHFDCFWMKEFQWCDFEWDKKIFTDPKNMLRNIKEIGLKISVWINPYIAQKSKLFYEGMKNGYFIKTNEGNVWQTDLWQPGMAIVDFTNPDACSWYKDKLKILLDMGIDCFKTDFGERIPHKGMLYFDGSDPLKMHNYYTYMYNKTVFELLEEERGQKNAVVFSRSATVGGQKYPVHWGGDCSASYESMAESLRGGLSLCLAGFGFWSHDIGGFEDTASPDLYKRWVAFGLLSSHSRLHGSNSYRVPWLFDDEAVEVVRYFCKLKCRLMPYLYSMAFIASQSGLPMMRAMFLEFSEDPICKYLDQQYMFGESLLVAPIFNSEGIASYYLPEGIWTNFFTNERVEGCQWIKEQHRYQSIPLLVRSNSVIPVGNIDNRVDYDFAYNVKLNVYELDSNSKTSVTVYNKEGVSELEVNIEKFDSTILIDFSGSGKPWSLFFVGLMNIKKIDSADYLITKTGLEIKPDWNKNKIIIYI